MIEINLNENDMTTLEKQTTAKIKENYSKNNEDIKNNNNNTLNLKDENNINKNLFKSNPNLNKVKEKNINMNPIINKVKTFNKDNRTDRFGNIIIHGGKQKVSFIDKISKNQFTEVVKVENFKEYNKMENISSNQRNVCCILL